jgi:hypothetical protein
MDANKNDNYGDGLRGDRFTGSSVVDSLDYERGKADNARGGGGGGTVVIAAVLLFPVVCAAYPIAGLTTIVTALLVTKGGPLFGIETGSGTLILVTLVAVLVAFLAGFFVERRLSRRKSYRIVRWIIRALLVPGAVVSLLLSKGINELGTGGIVVALVLLPVGYWVLRGLDRWVGMTSE